MTRFRFRLDTLVKIREKTRDAAAASVGEVRAAQQVIEQQIADVAQQQQDLMRERASQSSGAIQVERLLSMQRYQLQLEGQRNYLLQQRQALQVEHDKRLQVLIEAEKELKVLEKLREQKLQQWTEHQLSIEQKMLDELGSRIGMNDSRSIH